MDQNIENSQFSKIVDDINTEATSTVHDSGISDETNSLNSKEMESFCSPALFNEIVLDRVFGFLNVQEIKTCRRVCIRWNAVAKPVLHKNSIITLTPGVKQTFSELKMVFQNELPLENLKLRNSSNVSGPRLWSFSQLEEVLDCSENKLKHLDLDIHFKEKRSITYALRPETQCNLTTLILHCHWNRNHNMRVSLEYLTNIKVIRLLYNVILDIGAEGLKIAPREIDLRLVKFYSNGSRMDEVLLNNFIDFGTAKKIKICNSTEAMTQNLFLDMQQSINVYSLELEEVEILGGLEIKWNIDGCLLLGTIPWIQTNQMKFTSLDFKNAAIDISKLPPTIEHLALTRSLFMEINELSVFSSGPNVLHNLKYLSLDEGRNDTNQSCLHLFKDCMQLTAVYLKNIPQRYQPLPIIDLAALPISVRKLEIENPHCVEGYGFHRVATLILNNWSLHRNMLEEIRKFGARRIVIDSSSWGMVTQGYIKNCMKMIGLFQRRNEIDFWLGPAKFYDLTVQYYYKDHIGENLGNRDPQLVSEQEFQNIRRLSNSDSPLFSPRETNI